MYENLDNRIDVRTEVLEAEQRIKAHIRRTPVEYSHYLSQLGACQVYLKLENIQITGSFKIRGAMNKFLSLKKEERDKRIITASSGNHAAAFAYTLKKFGGKGTIYLPNYASAAKVENLKLYDADLEFYGDDCIKAEIKARAVAKKNGYVFVSPYNDPKIVGGQGTIAVELMEQVDLIDTLLAPVGGGGLISGVAGFLKSQNRDIEIIGCQPENSAVMYESIKAGGIVDMESKPTISDGTAGGMEQGSITFDICRNNVDDFILLSEEEIRAAIRLMLEKHSMLVEGSGALTVASFLKESGRFTDKNVVLIISGAKIGLDQLKELLL